MLEYNLDLREGSYNYSPTLDEFPKLFPFTCADSGYFNAGNAYFTRRSDYDSYLLLLTVGGRGRMTVDGRTCLLEKDSAVLIDCKAGHEYASLPPDGWRFHYLHFNALSMAGYRSALLSELTPVRLRAPEYACELMRRLYELSHQPDALSYAEQSNAISGLLTEMFASPAQGEDAPLRFRRADISELARYIRENCAEPLHIEDFMRLANLSRHYLIRLFKYQTGLSPYKYLHMCRVNQAQILLRSTQFSVEKIACAVGYKDPVIFIRHFRAFNRLTPGEYRRESFAALPDGDGGDAQPDVPGEHPGGAAR